MQSILRLCIDTFELFYHNVNKYYVFIEIYIYITAKEIEDLKFSYF